MLKRFLALIMIVSALGLGGCSFPELERDTMTVQLTWLSGDCDLGMRDPYGVDYWIDTRPNMPSGTFSADRTNGGTETWTMNYNHPTGIYSPMIYSDSTFGYTGQITLAITINGNTVYAYEEIAPSDILIFDVTINRTSGNPQYTVVRTTGGRPE